MRKIRHCSFTRRRRGGIINPGPGSWLAVKGLAHHAEHTRSTPQSSSVAQFSIAAQSICPTRL